jgi:acyl-CoA synthetase (AMP-forming)/AMP-acid ligase II
MDNLNQVRRYGPGEIMLSNSPLFWIGGFAFSLLATLVAGARIVCSNAIDTGAVLDLIERERPTLANGFAASVAHLPDDPTFESRDLSSIRRGNLWPILAPDVRPADPELRPTMLGLTETGSVCLLPDADEEVDLPESKRGLFGRPAPGFEARVVDPDTGEPTPTGEVGELWFRGPFLMEGYYGKERREAFDADGWFHTGDLVVVDDEGLYYFKGRSGDMIKTSGANVSPREVEAAIASATGLRSHVIGLDDPERGQLVAAAVVAPKDEAIDDARLEQVRTALSGELSSYKIPRVLVALTEDEVPMLSTGKLDGRTLQEILRTRSDRGA